MKDAYTAISLLHIAVGGWEWRTGRYFRDIDDALTHDELGPHPDDTARLDAMMEADANALRNLAHEIEMRRIELKRSAIILYAFQAAE